MRNQSSNTMEPVMILLFFFGLLQTSTIDIVFDNEKLLDGFIQTEPLIILDTWEKSNNGYFGLTENGDHFYLIVTYDTIKIKIWQDDRIMRLVEPIIFYG